MLKRLTLVLMPILFLSCFARAQQMDPITRWTTIAGTEFPFYSNVVYGEANTVQLHLDIITAGPKSVSRPTLIYFHGGGWLEGSKDGMTLYMLPYLAHGMDTVNVEYRMAPQSLAPAAVEDCRCALHWVYDHAREYGFDTHNLVVAGHSAGGHLALMTGMLRPSDGFDYSCKRLEDDWRKGTVDDVKVAAIINFFGPIDLPELLQGPNARNYAIRWFADMPNRMALAKRLTPLTYVRPGLPPILTIDGDKDPIVPFEQSVRLHQALDKAGDPNELLAIKGGGHGSTTPYAWTREQTLHAQEEVFRFLAKYGVISH